MSYEKVNYAVLLTPAETARLKRRAEILSEGAAMRKSGASFADIAPKYGVSRQRIQRMFADAGMSPGRRAASG